jgi:putative endopeptidase
MNISTSSVIRLRVALAAVLAMASFASLQCVAHDASGMDQSVKPGEDFYRYANGSWLKNPMPAAQTSYGTGTMLAEKNKQRVHSLMQEAAQSGAPKGSVSQKVGDYYATFLDETAIEAKGLSPVAHELARIAAIGNTTSLSDYLGSTLNSEVDALTANSDHVFGVWINQGFHDADHNYPHLWQGGLGLPDRDNYLDTSPDNAALRAKYQAHVSRLLRLAGFGDTDTRAARVLAFEIKIAQAFAPDADAADTFKQDNPWKRPDFEVKAPGMNWHAYFRSAGLDKQPDFIVWQPSAFTGVSALVRSESIDVWKDYLRVHLVDHYAGVLPRAIATEHASLINAAPGVQPTTNREDSAMAATNAALGQAVGQLYTQRYFPPQDKAKAQAMAANLVAAYQARIARVSWMSQDTKSKALQKLAALRIGIGYPDSWVDYATLEVVRGDAFGNMRRAEAFNRARNLARLRQTVADPMEWPINAQTPGAVIMFSPNVDYFSAGILQPPYFDSEGDAASNYGSAGAGMAHEISHSFDELGNIYDAQGRLGMWWTEADRAQFHALDLKLVAQFGVYCPLPDACVKSEQVLSENIADTAGLLVAHDAYLLSLEGKPDVVIGGLTGEQRFFVAFAQRWRRLQTEAALRKQIATDTHPPGEYRSDTVRNADAWYEAFGIASDDKLYLAPGERARIW